MLRAARIPKDAKQILRDSSITCGGNCTTLAKENMARASHASASATLVCARMPGTTMNGTTDIRATHSKAAAADADTSSAISIIAADSHVCAGMPDATRTSATMTMTTATHTNFMCALKASAAAAHDLL
jgi:hypothetical protein